MKTEQTDIPRGSQYVAACPYCRHLNRGRLTPTQDKSLTASGRVTFRALMTCDNEEGGCDRAFVIRVGAEIHFDVDAFAIRGLDPAADDDARADAPDLRVWQLTTKAADEPRDQLHAFNVAEIRAMVKGSPLYALAAEMRGGDKLDFVSVEGLISYHFECFEPEDGEGFASFVLAKREARRRALRTGSPVEIYFDGERFWLYLTTPASYPPPPSDFEEVIRVEPPVVFKIRVDRLGETGATAGFEGMYSADVDCDDRRANPDFQNHGNATIWQSPTPFANPEDAGRDAADWIRSEFPELDLLIECPFDVEPADIPL